MYYINTAKDKPDARELKATLEILMRRGIRVDNVQKAYDYFTKTVEGTAVELKDEYGIDNPNSTKQIEYYLSNCDDADIYEVCYQNGKWTSNKEALETLKQKGYRFAELLMQYRKSKKLADAAKSLMSLSDSNGCVHPLVSLTKTNRISYASPALMNIPKKLLWDVVTSYKPGNKLWSADIKNQEPSILINIIGADELKPALNSKSGLYEYMFNKCFRPYTTCTLLVMNGCKAREVPYDELKENTQIPMSLYSKCKPECPMTYECDEGEFSVLGISNMIVTSPVGEKPVMPKTVYIETTGGAFRVPVKWEKIPDKACSKVGKTSVVGYIDETVHPVCEGVYRKEFKTAWNAMTYGSSKFGIQAVCKHIDGSKVYDFFHKIPEMKRYQSIWKKEASLGHNSNKSLFGSVLYTDETDPRRLARVLMDLPIQGTGADILSLLVRHFNEEVSSRGIADKLMIYYTRHDEIIMEVDANWQQEVGEAEVERIIRDILEHQVNNWEPFRLEVSQVHGEFGDLLNGVDDEE